MTKNSRNRGSNAGPPGNEDDYSRMLFQLSYFEGCVSNKVFVIYIFIVTEGRCLYVWGIRVTERSGEFIIIKIRRPDEKCILDCIRFTSIGLILGVEPVPLAHAVKSPTRQR